MDEGAKLPKQDDEAGASSLEIKITVKKRELMLTLLVRQHDSQYHLDNKHYPTELIA